jgi:DNA-binding NarL/FixJ family response regulator
MIATKLPSQPLERIKSNLLPVVISEFTVKDVRYLVIATNSPTMTEQINETLRTLLEKLNVLMFSTVDQFVVNHQTFIIVEVQANKDESLIDLASLLTARELQIATLVAQGLQNKQVAKKLHISEWTVSTHLRRIFAKLHVDSRAAMVYCCAPLIRVPAP